MLHPVYGCFKKLGKSNHILGWKSKRLSDEKIKPAATSDSNLPPIIKYYNIKSQVKFDGSYLKQDKVIFSH